jgi:hypothetical protein
MEKTMNKCKMAWIMIVMLLFEAITPHSVQAKELYAFAKEAIPCYQKRDDSSKADSIPHYSGFSVGKNVGGYYQVTYTKKGKTKTGWIKKSDYKDNCLAYDGSEIPMIASGSYLIGGQKIEVSRTEEGYRLFLSDTKKYISVSGSESKAALRLTDLKEDPNNIWIFQRHNYNLLIQNQQTGLYMIPSGSVIRMVDYEKARQYGWIFIREGKNTDPYRNFVQYDGRWGAKKYGSSTQMAQAACGVLAVVNAAFALSGQFIDPMDGAQYACDHGYRVEYNGTDEEYMKAFAQNLGEKYGFIYAGKTESISGIKKCLKAGGVVTAHVPGHYVCIADYDEEKDKFLVLDSHPLPKRKTSPFGSWVTQKRLMTGGLQVSTAYKYTRVEDAGFVWNLSMQKLEALQDIATNLSPYATKDTLEQLYRQKGK